MEDNSDVSANVIANSRSKHLMKGIVFLLVTVAAVGGFVASMAPASGQADREVSPLVVTKAPPGYRDWKLISVAHEEGNLNSIGAILGNDVAIKAYREKKLPFPDGAIIAALHYMYVSSEENNRVFGRSQSSARQRTFSLWSRTPKSTLRQAVGDSVTSTRTAPPATRHL